MQKNLLCENYFVYHKLTYILMLYVKVKTYVLVGTVTWKMLSFNIVSLKTIDTRVYITIIMMDKYNII